tara:strand:+ start:32 stop:658 length:627 start_codon:yes stop_codon:yes gene_type:complete
MSYSILPFFSKPFYIKTLDSLEDNYFNKLLSVVKKQPYKKEEKIFSNVSKNYKILEDKQFSTLKKHILKEFDFYKNDILRYNNTNFKIVTSWLTKAKKGQVSRLHCHKNSMFSGVFYFSVNKKQLNISFENLQSSNYSVEPTEFNIYNSIEQKIIVEDKTLILFPSEVHHQILENISKKDRYSLAFNVIPDGEYGPTNSDSRVNIKVL